MSPPTEVRPGVEAGARSRRLAGGKLDLSVQADGRGQSPRRSWPAILEQAAAIVEGYDTGVTLRQLFYRLVSVSVLPNSQSAYKQLSSRSAEARREGWFPELIDRGRLVHEDEWFTSPADALDSLARWYRLDRTDGQTESVYLGVEKNGLVEQLTAWFGDRGLPVLALGGYSSHSYITTVRGHVARTGRPAVLLYAGDFDPSGEDIDRDFLERTACFDKVVRVALSPEQVEEYALPPQPGKATDSRAAAFVARHGELVQVEVDALPPETLRDLFAEAVEPFWDVSAFEAVLAREQAERVALDELAQGWST